LHSVFPNDPYFNLQWGLHNTGQAGGESDADIDAPEAWDYEQGESSVIIGIIDTGVQGSHEDLSGKVSGESIIGHPHGTHVAGIAAANTNNGIGVAGVSWNSLIHAEEIYTSSFDDAEIYQDIKDAVQAGAFVLNDSWGGPDYSITIRAGISILGLVS
jgi:subtilisin family serine protease